MRHLRLKRQRAHRTAAGERLAFRDEFGYCWVCLRRDVVLDVHEIARGAARAKAYGERCCWVLVCRECHDEVQRWPVYEQLALKGLRDPEKLDRQRVNIIRGRRPDAIDEWTVWVALQDVLQKVRS